MEPEEQKQSRKVVTVVEVENGFLVTFTKGSESKTFVANNASEAASLIEANL